MSDKLSKENDELARVLNRINALMKHGEHGEVPAEISAQTESAAENIPQLTEVYEGEPLIFMTHPADEFPTLSEFVGNAEAYVEAIPAGISQAEKMEALLAQMVPLVRDAIQKAVLRKIIDAGEVMQAQIEAEIMQTLRERLQSLALNSKS